MKKELDQLLDFKTAVRLGICPPNDYVMTKEKVIAAINQCKTKKEFKARFPKEYNYSTMYKMNKERDQLIDMSEGTYCHFSKNRTSPK